ncbi:MAG: cell division protein ZapA [Schleiferiaceae bacterium]
MSTEDSSQKIKVKIANRVYPLTVKRTEEARFRKAVSLINEMVQQFEEKYAVRDKQDILAMCALQFANQLAKQKEQKADASLQVTQDLKAIDNLLSSVLAGNPE